MTTIPSDIYQNANKLTEEEKTNLVQATTKEIAKYFNVVPADNKRLRGHDVSRRSTPGDPTNEDTRVLMAFVKALYNALFNGEWADPNTLELAPNGKIRVKDVFVDGDRQPDVNNGNDFYLIDKLPEAVKAKVTALLKDGGGLSFDENGKLKVDFQSLTVDQLYALCDPEGGIVVNEDEESAGFGKLQIDFSKMPLDRFQAMLSALHVPIWIGDTIGEGENQQTVGSNFYVDGSTGINTLADGQGTSPDKPWRTINYATHAVCENYNIGAYDVNIYVAGGTYAERVDLPMQSRTTGSITIRPLANSGTVSIVGTSTRSGQYTCNHTGGLWYLESLNLKLIIGQQTTNSTSYPSIVRSSDMTGAVWVKNCNLEFEDNSVASSSSYGAVKARGFSSVQGTIGIENTSGNKTTTWSGTKGNASFFWIHSEKSGSFVANRNGSKYEVAGSFDYFCHMTTSGRYYTGLSGTVAQFIESGTVTGYQYTALTGGGIATDSGNITDYFPGTVDPGTPVETASYSYAV